MAEKELSTLVQWFDSYEEATMSARQLAERDRDYYDGKQWTAEETATLQKRGQPVLTFNRIAPKVNFLLGYEQQSRTDPKAFPRTPQDEQSAEAATDAIRYACDASHWDEERSACFEDIIVEGVCGAEVRVERMGEDIDIKVEHVPWDRLFWDPRSRYADFRDAKFMGTVVWMDLEDALAVEKWKDSRDVLEQAATAAQESALSQTFEDRPRFAVWSQSERGRVRVKIAQVWYRVGSTWYVATYTQSGFLEPCKESPYKDRRGKSLCGLFLQSSFVDRDNNRYGAVRALISPQDEINKRRSKSLHLLSVRQVVAEKDAVDNVIEAKQELAKPDGIVFVNPNTRFEIQPNSDMTSGHFQLLQEAKAEIDNIGANPALTGDNPRAQSGRAIQALQQGGLTELGKVFGGFRSWQKRIYEAIWHRVQQFWTAQKWVRVTDNEDNLKYVGLNHPVTMAEEMQAQGVQVPPEAAADPMVQMQMQQVVRIENNVAEMDVDIIVDESPDFVTLQQEQFEQLTQMAAAGIPIPPDVLIMASSLRNKREILERMKAGGASPEEQQAAAQAQAQAQQMQMQAAQLELAQKEADVRKTEADTLLKQSQAQKYGADTQKTQVDTVTALAPPLGAPETAQFGPLG